MKVFYSFFGFSALTSVTSKLPVGDEELGARQDTNDYVFSQTLLRDMGFSRIFGNYTYMYIPQGESDIDVGDVSMGMLGLDMPLPLGDKINVYGALFSSQNFADKNGDGNRIWDTQQITMDTTFGLVFRDINLRTGITVPVYTYSKQIEHSDRSPLFDVGFRFSL
ncbi:hypothetical protein WDW89_02440 [Deltaproteobacteria bacterium TL4]